MNAPRTKIFVGHLPDGCRSEDLLSLFSKFGTVTECDVINKYGFVHMRTPEQAESAIRGLNNYNLRGSAISVEYSKSLFHPEPGAPGRARGGNMPTSFGSRRVGSSRNDYSFQITPRKSDNFSPFGSLSSNLYFNDRSLISTRREARSQSFRPQSSSYEQSSIMFTSPASDLRQRSMLAPIGTRDQYSVSMSSSLPSRSDTYDRFFTSSSPFLFSQRSPPRTMSFDPLGSQLR